MSLPDVDLLHSAVVEARLSLKRFWQMQNTCGYEDRFLAADFLFYTVLRIPAAVKSGSSEIGSRVQCKIFD